MKKNIILFIALIVMVMTNISVFGQAKNDPSAIALTIIVPEGIDGFPEGAKSVLSNKLFQVATANGLAAGENFGRFFITAIPSILTKDVVPGPPTQVAQNMEITFYIADYFDQKVFATTSISCKGVGTNDTKAYIEAIKRIGANSPQLKEFIENGKQKIVDYYIAQCDNIINKAKSLAGQKSYEEALYLLTAIPEATGGCFSKSLVETQNVYQQYVNQLCDVNFALAKSAWAAEQNSAGAQKAGIYLSNIYPDAACYGEAEKLYKEIKGKVLDDWKFVMKMYQDGVNLESQRINAWRDVGVAFGKNQQPTTYNIAWLVR